MNYNNKSNILPKLSEEQTHIINSLNNNNIVVDSVAGSGKTTTNLYISKHFEKNKILLLTFNAKLKIETRQKTKLYNISNLDVHSYHSFCVNYYNEKCYRDNEISKIILNNQKPIKLLNYDIIILDESQDINPLYFELIYKIFKDNNNNKTKICILGDKYQSIYDFNNADNRFIIYAPQCFNFNKLYWKECCLTESFRVTDKVSQFINNCMLNFNRIKSSKKGIKPEYIICDTFDDDIEDNIGPFSKVNWYLNNGYKPEDIFILAPSVKSVKTPVRRLENNIKLKLKNIPIFVSNNDDEKIDESIIEKKLVISTFHQTKGLERKIVFIFNFDNSYFKFYKKDKNPKICPNELYVATTRALDHLILFHHYHNDYLPFLNNKLLRNYTNFQEKITLSIISYNIIKNINTSSTDLCNHLPDHIINECMTFIKIINIQSKNKKINIPLKTKQKKTYESVSEINGTAIPLYFEYYKKGKINIIDILPSNENQTMFSKSTNLFIDSDSDSDSDSNSHSDSDDDEKYNDIYNISKIKDNINNKTIAINELLYLTNRWITYKNGYLFKIKQITNYNWLSDKNMKECINNLEKLNISDNSIFEKYIEIENEDELLNRKLIGYIDCIDKNNIYEFKCVDELENKHYLQLAIYAYAYEITEYNQALKTDLNFLNKNDIILYNDNKKGKIIQIFKNGNINVKNLITNKIDKISKNNIINNITNFENKKKNNIKNSYFLYNILTDELNKIIFDINELKKMMKFLIFNKYFLNTKNISDDEFINKCKKIIYPEIHIK